MTDSYVEKLLINKFLEIASVEATPKAYQYYQDNKENPDCLESFKAFQPEYPAGATDEEKSKIDGPLILELITWFKDIYPQYYKTEHGTEEDDLLFEDIKNVEISDIRRTIKIYDDKEDFVELNMYPNVAFPNSSFIRPQGDDGNNINWYEIFFIPGRPVQIELGTTGRSRWVGVMQVNICIPKEWGTDELLDRYDEVAKLFKSGLIIEGVRIARTYRSVSLDNDDYYCLPVSIEWQADLDR